MSNASHAGVGSTPNKLGSPADGLKELADRKAGEPIKTAVDRAAHRCGLSYWRAFDIWYGKARRIEESERASIAEALVQYRRKDIRNEVHELRLRLAAIEARLAAQDTTFDSAAIAAGWALAGQSR